MYCKQDVMLQMLSDTYKHPLLTAGTPPPQAKEFGVPEVWMNERLMRIAPRSFAKFLYAFEEANGKQPDLLWLVWCYEGDYTLFDLLQVPGSHTRAPTHNPMLTIAARHPDPHRNSFHTPCMSDMRAQHVRHAGTVVNMWVLQASAACLLHGASLARGACCLIPAFCLVVQQKRDWPYNAEAVMKGRKQPSSNRSPKRKLDIIRGMMRQILVGLKACHNTGAPTGIALHCALQTAIVHLRPPYCNQQHWPACEALIRIQRTLALVHTDWRSEPMCVQPCYLAAQALCTAM
jgi:hypothetical protein